MRKLFPYFLAGVFFGVVLTRAEIVSWYRIKEMFRFHSFHMYGILMSGAAVAALSLLLLRRAGAATRTGEPIRLEPKTLGRGHRYWVGGTIFGVGWAFTGACPGPLFVRERVAGNAGLRPAAAPPAPLNSLEGRPPAGRPRGTAPPGRYRTRTTLCDIVSVPVWIRMK